MKQGRSPLEQDKGLRQPPEELLAACDGKGANQQARLVSARRESVAEYTLSCGTSVITACALPRLARWWRCGQVYAKGNGTGKPQYYAQL